MSGFLLDTNVISMVSPSVPSVPKPFLGWLERMDEEGRILLSVVTAHEIEKGIALLDHKGATAKATVLRVWLSGLIAGRGNKIPSLDTDAAAASGRLEADAIADGQAPGMADAIIAGIARAHDLERRYEDDHAKPEVCPLPTEIALFGDHVSGLLIPKLIVSSRDCAARKGSAKG